MAAIGQKRKASSGAGLAGATFLALGFGFLLFLARGRLVPSQRSADEEIISLLGDLKSVLARDQAAAGEVLLPLELAQPDAAGLMELRNTGQFWEPAFREAAARMRKK